MYKEEELMQRTERLLGAQAMERLKQTRVILFGVGGVGSWCAEGLVRTGIGHLTIVDNDAVSVSNINRQLMATTLTVGRPKVEALKERLLTINPHADITALQTAYTAETAESFGLENYDYIIDAIDSLDCKCRLILHAAQQPATLFSSMGAALKLDPTRIRVDEFWKVNGCPLARAMRNRLKRDKTFPKKKFRCVYSDEVLKNEGQAGETAASAWDAAKAQINGSLCHITAIFGFTLAGLVVEDIWLSRNSVGIGVNVCDSEKEQFLVHHPSDVGSE